MKFSGVTILQGVEFSIFPIDFEWTLQQCSATALLLRCLRYKLLFFYLYFLFLLPDLSTLSFCISRKLRKGVLEWFFKYFYCVYTDTVGSFIDRYTFSREFLSLCMHRCGSIHFLSKICCHLRFQQHYFHTKQLAQPSLTKPRDAMHHDKRQNFKTVTWP